MALSRLLPLPLAWALADTVVLSLVWMGLHLLRFGLLPEISRGPLLVIPLLVALQWLLGTYSGLARHTLSFQEQANRYLLAATGVILTIVLGYAFTGLSLDATVGRGFLLPVLLSGAVSGALLRQLDSGHHLWQPRQRWLVLASRDQRQAVAREMERGGCAVPAAIEWRDPMGTAPLPPMLATLLGLQGVALGVGDAVREEDRKLLLLWQRRGLLVLPLDQWCERYLRSLPTAVLPADWPSRLERFGRLRQGQNARLKRLEDLVLGSLALALLAPPLALTLPLLRLGGRRWRLERETRLGLEGQPFALPSIAVTPEPPRWWRRTGLERVPELVSVLRGDLALVGPRPLAPARAEAAMAADPALAMRFWIKPGLLRWRPGRSPSPPRAGEPLDALAEDLCYMAGWSPWLDLRCLLLWLVGRR
ncbi:MAG: sugar transferase [Cyanobacteriota bacterium]|jgi:lipopolysaccharide/colanic/teichoic acid biosynthesis glycosyltransferase